MLTQSPPRMATRRDDRQPKRFALFLVCMSLLACTVAATAARSHPGAGVRGASAGKRHLPQATVAARGASRLDDEVNDSEYTDDNARTNPSANALQSDRMQSRAAAETLRAGGAGGLLATPELQASRRGGARAEAREGRPLLEGERRLVFAASMDGSLSAVDVDDGTLLWSLKADPLLQGQPQVSKVTR